MKRNILLIEPNYKNKYPPMGLMKIAMYHRLQGDNVVFWKGELRDFILRELTETLINKLYELDLSIESEAPEFSASHSANKVNWRCFTPELTHAVKTGHIEPDSQLELAISKSPFAMSWVTNFHKQFNSNAYLKNPKWDRVCITTLFTFYWDLTVKTINEYKQLCKSQTEVHVGGILASLVPELLEKATGIKPHVGIISETIYPGDSPLPQPFTSVPIDELPLDYSIIEETDYDYPEKNAYYGYATRGCVNQCKFCAVPILEPSYRNYIPLIPRVQETNKRFGEQRNLLLLDNNVFASKQFDSIIDDIIRLGFEKNASYIAPNLLDITIKQLQDNWNDRAYIKLAVRLLNEFVAKQSGDKQYEHLYSLLIDNNLLHSYSATKEAIFTVYNEVKDLYENKRSKHPIVRFVDFNQGLDARRATHHIMEKISRIAIRPMRIAFDNWALRLVYVKAIILAKQNGITQLSNYLLYNYNDTPTDLYLRLLINIELCDELGVNIYSFPMKYHPIFDEKWLSNRDFIGDLWSRKEIRTIQAILNSTHGKIGKGRTFFYKAFGRNEQEFQQLLIMPEAFIIKRWDAEICGLKDKWLSAYQALPQEQKEQLIEIVKKNDFSDEKIQKASDCLKEVLCYYKYQREDIPLATEEEKQRQILLFESSCPHTTSELTLQLISEATSCLESDLVKEKERLEQEKETQQESIKVSQKRPRGRPRKNSTIDR